MPIETLKKGILFGMKQNLMIQYVFPDYALPEEYASVIESIDNVKIYPIGCKPVTGISDDGETDVIVINSVSELEKNMATIFETKMATVIRLSFDDHRCGAIHGRAN